MKHFLLFYQVTDRYWAKRHIFRPEHFEHAWAASERGELVVGGALEPQEGMCVVMFAGEDRKAAEDFARNDPYVREGLVREWRVAEWVTVAGDLASSPMQIPNSGSEMTSETR